MCPELRERIVVDWSSSWSRKSGDVLAAASSQTSICRSVGQQAFFQKPALHRGQQKIEQRREAGAATDAKLG
jgi:hypothetical protein